MRPSIDQKSGQKTAVATALFKNTEDDQNSVEWKGALDGDAKSHAQLMFRLKCTIKSADVQQIQGVILQLNKLLEKNKKNLEAKLMLALYCLELGYKTGNGAREKEGYRFLNEVCDCVKDREIAKSEENKKILARAYEHLAWCYEEGVGTEKYQEQVEKSYNIAEMLGGLGKAYNSIIKAKNENAEAKRSKSKNKSETDAKDAEIAKRFLELAEKGHDKSQYEYAMCCVKHIGIQRGENADTIAFNWFMKAAEQYDSPSQFEVGYAYERGEGVAEDEVKALHFFRLAAMSGDSAAQNKVGQYYEGGKANLSKNKRAENRKEAFKWYRSSAEKMDRFGLFNYARCFEEGIGTAIDIPAAIKYYSSAYDQDNKKAAYRLYLIYKSRNAQKNQKVKDNEKLMYEWCEKAVKGRVFIARIALAEHLLKGEGCRRDVKDAEKVLERAVCIENEEGDDDDLGTKPYVAVLTLVRWLVTGFEGYPKSEGRAFGLLQELARSKDIDLFPEVSYELACWYASGRGGVQEVPRAMELYKRFVQNNRITAAERQEIIKNHYSCSDCKHHPAMGELNTQPTISDLKTRNRAIFNFFNTKIDNKDSFNEEELLEAHFWVGFLLSRGDGETIPRDNKKANDYLKLAADNFFICEYPSSMVSKNQGPTIFCAALVYADFIFHHYLAIGVSLAAAEKYYAKAEEQYAADEFKESDEAKKVLARIATRKLQCTGKLAIPAANSAATTADSSVPVVESVVGSGSGSGSGSMGSVGGTKKEKNKRKKTNKKNNKKKAQENNSAAGPAVDADLEAENLEETQEKNDTQEPNPFSAAFEIFNNRIFALAVRDEKQISNRDYKQQPHQIKQKRQEELQEIDEAWKLLRNGDYDDALVIFKRYPQNIRALIGVINYHLSLFQFIEALQKATKLVEQYPKKLEVLCTYVRVKSRVERIADNDPRFIELQELKQQHPQNIMVSICCIRVWSNNQIDKAFYEAEKLYQQHSNVLRVVLCYIDCLVRKRKYREALMIAERLYEKNPNVLSISLKVAKTSVYVYGIEHALKKLQDISKKYPRYEKVKEALVKYYVDKDDFENAILLHVDDGNLKLYRNGDIERIVKFLIEKYRNSERRLCILGMSFQKLAHYRYGKDFFEAALKINSRCVLALLGLNARVTKPIKIDFRGLDRELEEILNNKSDLKFSITEYLAYAKFLAKSYSSSDKVKSHSLFDALVQRFPDYLRVYEERIINALHYDPQRCLDYSNEILEIFPYQPIAYLLAAKVYVQFEKEEELAALYAKAKQNLLQDKRFFDELDGIVAKKPTPTISILEMKFDFAMQAYQDKSDLADEKQNKINASSSSPVAANATTAAAAIPSVSVAPVVKNLGSLDEKHMDVAPVDAQQTQETYGEFMQRMRAKGDAILDELNRLAGQNYVLAQVMLAEIYAGIYDDILKEPDYAQAVFWWKRAAENNDADSQFNLGIAYMNGQGVGKDLNEGMKWIEKASRQEHLQALCNYGLAHIEGTGGVEQNNEKANECLVAVVVREVETNSLTEMTDFALNKLKNTSGFKEVLELLDSLTADYGDHSIILYHCSLIYAQGDEDIKKDPAKAMGYLQRAMHLDRTGIINAFKVDEACRFLNINVVLKWGVLYDSCVENKDDANNQMRLMHFPPRMRLDSDADVKAEKAVDIIVPCV